MAGESEVAVVTGPRAPFIYNPALLPPEELKRLFLVRHAELDQILSRVRSPGPTPQHLLVIGQRGMGKTTLLIRLDYAIREDPDLAAQWLPVRFDEEQYNIGELADFWLNCLDKISEETGDPEPQQAVDRLVKEHQAPAALQEAALSWLREYSHRKHRRLLLLVDNFDQLLDRITPRDSKVPKKSGGKRSDEAHQLREVLQHQSWLMLVAAAARPVEETFDYDKPLYDFFQVIFLQPLSLEESQEFLAEMAKVTSGDSRTLEALGRKQTAITIIHVLVGGNLRSIMLLLSLLQRDPDAETPTLIDHLLDQQTSYYKDLIESLPPQGQRVFDSLARTLNPVSADAVAAELRIDRGAASAQLHRLVDRGLVEKVPLPQRSLGFQVQDRLFNLWYLMRGGRRQRRQLPELIDFLELLLDPAPQDLSHDRLEEMLQGLSLIDAAEIEKAHELAVSEESAQGALGFGREAKPRLLALCLAGKDELALQQAETLTLAEDAAFFQIVRAFLIDRLGNAERALEIIERQIRERPHGWLFGERLRLLVKSGRAKAAMEGEAAPQFDEVPPHEIASLAKALASAAIPNGEWVPLALLSRARPRAEGNLRYFLAACAVESRLRHPEQALENFRSSVETFRAPAPRRLQRELLDLALLLSKEHAEDVLAILKETGLSERWKPLEYALLSRGEGGEDSLTALAPEMREFTKFVLARIEA